MRFIRGFNWKHLPKPDYLMTRLFNDSRNCIRNILIQDKPHLTASAICRATR